MDTMINSADLAAVGKAIRHYQPKLIANLVAEGYRPEDRQLAIYVLRSLGDWEAAYANAPGVREPYKVALRLPR